VDISEIRQKAVPYYACFISRLMNSPDATLTFDEIHRSSWVEGDDPSNGLFLLNDLTLIELAIEYLEEENIVRLVTDEFAPRIVIQHRNFGENLNALFRREDTLFSRYLLAGEGRAAWLNKALSNINLRMKAWEEEEKVEGETANADIWQPIPLDRGDQHQQQATKTLDRIIEELRGDNGYAATYPEEKAFVQDKLTAVSKRLKEDSQISWMYLLEFAFKPLGIIIKRFGEAAAGIAASAARESLSSWLKSKGISLLDDLFK
jgi:hypothetical protein